MKAKRYEQAGFEFSGGDGLQLKQEGIRQVVENASPSWKESIVNIIRKIAGRQQDLTSDDVRQQAEQESIPEPHHPNAWGGAMYSAASADIIEATGNYCQSRRPDAHSRPISIWRSKIFGR